MVYCKLIRTNDRKTNTRGIVSDQNKRNSSNKMDLTCLSRISLFLENNKNDSLITLFIEFATKNRKNMLPHHVLTRDKREHKN